MEMVLFLIPEQLIMLKKMNSLFILQKKNVYFNLLKAGTFYGDRYKFQT